MNEIFKTCIFYHEEKNDPVADKVDLFLKILIKET